MDRVVIAEDSPDIAALLDMQIRSDGYDVQVVSEHFEQILDIVDWSTVDIAIVDRMLGSEIDGLDILRALKDKHPHVRRIVLSAYSSSHDMELGIADEYLEKPFDPRMLKEVLGRNGR